MQTKDGIIVFVKDDHWTTKCLFEDYSYSRYVWVFKTIQVDNWYLLFGNNKLRYASTSYSLVVLNTYSYMILQYDSNKLELGARGSPTTKFVPPSLRDDRTAWQSESMNQNERGS